MPSCIRVPSMATAPRPSCSGRSNAGPCRACPHPAPHSAHQRLTVIGFWRRDGYRRWPRHRGTASPQQHIPGVAQRLCPHGYQIQPKHSEPEGDPAATDPRHESRVEGALVSAFGTPRTVRSSLSPEESGVRSSAVTPTRVCERQRLQPFDLPVYVGKRQADWHRTAGGGHNASRPLVVQQRHRHSTAAAPCPQTLSQRCHIDGVRRLG